MNCDRNTTKQDELSINFCDFIVAPFFFTLTKLLPRLVTVDKEIKINRTIWYNMLVVRLSQEKNDDNVTGKCVYVCVVCVSVLVCWRTAMCICVCWRMCTCDGSVLLLILAVFYTHTYSVNT